MSNSSSLVATYVICFANSSNPDQAQHFVGLDLDPNCLYSDGIPERFLFEKGYFNDYNKSRKTLTVWKEDFYISFEQTV